LDGVEPARRLFIVISFRGGGIETATTDVFLRAGLMLVGDLGEAAHVGEEHRDPAARAHEGEPFGLEQLLDNVG
jgi:hypothetical protein